MTCRDALEAILDAHYVAICDQWTEEWNLHQSPASLTWRTRMAERRRFRFVPVQGTDSPVWKAIEPVINVNQRELVVKDVFLVEMAVATDERVVSCDRRVRDALREAKLCPPAVARVHWVSPRHDDGVVDWLKNGAEQRGDWLIVPERKTP